jgi:hypothetical protein
MKKIISILFLLFLIIKFKYLDKNGEVGRLYSYGNIDTMYIYVYNDCKYREYTLFTLSDSKSVEEILLAEKALVIRNLGRNPWSAMLDWKTVERPLMYFPESNFENGKNSGIDVSHIGFFYREYYDKNSEKVKISQSCNIDNDVCIDWE